MIKQDLAFQLSGVTSQLCMKYRPDNSRTTAVLAVISHRPTSNRKGPPDCGNGFDTSYLPFAKGHLIALELGGSDDAYNVVPQFEDWQGKPNGAWRQMEIALSATKFNGSTMLVEVGYTRSGNEEVHDAARDAFEDDRIRDWTDPRIPNSFRVQVWAATHALAAINTDVKFDDLVTNLKKTATSADFTFDLGNGIPEPDRGMYINQYALSVAIEQHTTLARSDSVISFLLEPGVVDEVRKETAKTPGIQATEATGLQAFPLMFAFQVGVTGPKIKKKAKQRRKLGIPTLGDAEIGIPPTKKRRNDN